MDSEGRVIKKWGDITTEIFPRSALKLIQTFGIITTGAEKAKKNQNPKDYMWQEL